MNFIEVVKTGGLQHDFYFDVSHALKQFRFAGTLLWALNNLSKSDPIGRCMLIETFHKTILSKFSRMGAAEAETTGTQYGEDFLTAIHGLRLTVNVGNSNVIMFEEFQKALADAFGGEYRDPFRLVSEYINDLTENMKLWVRRPTDFNAPYTSVVNASMTGKSRLIKEIAMKIPTIYICLREQNDGYPTACPKDIANIFTSPYYNPDISSESNEDNIVRLFLAFFYALLNHFSEWCQKYDAKNPAQLAELRKQLWLALAEPNKSGSESNSFWEEVGRDTRNTYSKKNEFGIPQLLEKMEEIWTTLKPFLTYTVNGKTESLLLIVWDEARILVNTNVGGQPADISLASVFRLLRRALRRMGRYGNPPVFRIFSLFSDTSSRLGNFQPRNDTDSSRAPIKVPGGPLMFRPIVLMPSLDAAARSIAITCNPIKVKGVSRLIRLGRVAWHMMKKKKTPVDLLELAVSKLYRTAREELSKLFASESLDDTKLKMLACLGPRLAIQVGPYVTATKELVASHMMTLERVGENHDHLEARYLSEPILCEAAAEGTATYGWTKPLEALVSEMRHGIVDKGYRGEFITKVLLCMAVEDVQRRVWENSTSHKGWKYSQPITVGQFLNSLLRSPAKKEQAIPASAKESTYPTSGKRELSSDDEGPDIRTTKKFEKMSFDDSTTDEEEEVHIDRSDGVPTPADGFVEYIDSEADLHGLFGPKTQKEARSNH